MASKKPNNPKIIEEIEEISTESIFKSPRAFGWLLTIASAIGLFASFTLTAEKIFFLRNPRYIPSCNINPILSCTSVMKTPQADIFGIPNSLVGIVAFSVILTIGVSYLFGARMNKLFWKLFNLGALGGFLSLFYFFYQSVYRIGSLCIYCTTVWAMTALIFWYVTLWNIEKGNITVPSWLKHVEKFFKKHHLDSLVVLYFVIIALIVSHFWYYFKTL